MDALSSMRKSRAIVAVRARRGERGEVPIHDVKQPGEVNSE
jgi:hypothetical protein